jgi:hypothetical protein
MPKAKTKEIQPTIGSIVTLKSNHLKSESHYPEIRLAGEPNFQTPLMIISEILIQNPEKVDEETGKIKSVKGKYRYKCIWFSAKLFKFEEGWFFDNELLTIKIQTENPDKIEFGQTLVLKTNALELQKKKTHIEIDLENKTNKTNSLLTFTSPVFILIGYSNVEKKEPELDPKTGKRKRIFPEKLAKIKAFNLKDDKYSEFLIPIEAIEAIIDVDIKIINKIVKTIKSNRDGDTQIYFPTIDEELITGLYDIKSLLSISGSYILNCKNILNQKSQDLSIKDLSIQNPIVLPFNNQFYPDIKKVRGRFSIVSILQFLDQEKNSFKTFENWKKEKTKTPSVFKISYKNKHEKYTTRFIIPQQLFSVEINDKEVDSTGKASNKKKIEHYLKAFCLLRNAERNFKIERMQSLDVIKDDDFASLSLRIWGDHR